MKTYGIADIRNHLTHDMLDEPFIINSNRKPTAMVVPLANGIGFEALRKVSDDVDPATVVGVALSLADWITLGAAIVKVSPDISVENDRAALARIAAIIGESVNQSYLGATLKSVRVSADALDQVREVVEDGRAQIKGRSGN